MVVAFPFSLTHCPVNFIVYLPALDALYVIVPSVLLAVFFAFEVVSAHDVSPFL